MNLAQSEEMRDPLHPLMSLSGFLVMNVPDLKEFHCGNAGSRRCEDLALMGSGAELGIATSLSSGIEGV